LDKLPVVALVGATATGKSGLAYRLARSLDGEIISGDSMQIYKGMDIGTAKPTREERQAVPHHLIDIAEITEAFSVAVFIEKATMAINDIAKRGRLPIIAGGTGLYISLLLSGTLLPCLDSDEKLRNKLFEKAKIEGNEALHKYLKTVDPKSAEKIHPNNVKRVVRAIEIYLTSGLTKTEQSEKSRQSDSPYDYKLIYLTSSDRNLLYNRINTRVDKMFDTGLEAEVKSLYEKGLADTPTASQAIGYKEFFRYFKGQTDLISVSEEIKKHTRKYAKRQMTFFNGMEGKMIFDISTEAEESIYKKIYDICQPLKEA